jgi:hypothetical protein
MGFNSGLKGLILYESYNLPGTLFDEPYSLRKAVTNCPLLQDEQLIVLSSVTNCSYIQGW